MPGSAHVDGAVWDVFAAHFVVLVCVDELQERAVSSALFRISRGETPRLTLVRSWIVPIIGSVFFGAGIYIIILAVLNYVVDSYQTYSASALAGVILVRNIVRPAPRPG